MQDRQRAILIKRGAYAYLVSLLLVLFSAFLPDKATGLVLLLTLFPTSTLGYILAYYLLARGYEDETRCFVSFSSYGGGTLEGMLYTAAKGFVFLALLLALYHFLG